MATFIETMPKYEAEFLGEVFDMKPVGDANGTFIDGQMRVSFFVDNYAAIANATLPLAQEHYDALKEINKYWKINAINWRKNGIIEMYIPADEVIQEEEDFLLEMYPPAPSTEEQPTEEA